MVYDNVNGWKPKDIAFWIETQINIINTQQPDWNTSVGSNLYLLTSAWMACLASIDWKASTIPTKTMQKIQEAKTNIETSKSVTPSGIRSGFLDLAPLVQKCEIIQATRENPQWYILLELDKTFDAVTEDEKIILLSTGSSLQGTGLLPIKHPNTLVTIEGEGLIQASYQDRGVPTVLNEILKREIVPLLIEVIIIDGYINSVHIISERNAIIEEFSNRFTEIQQPNVDFVKINYSCELHNDIRKEWMYDFNFFDNSDPALPIEMNTIIVEEYEYLILPKNVNDIKVVFKSQAGDIIG